MYDQTPHVGEIDCAAEGRRSQQSLSQAQVYVQPTPGIECSISGFLTPSPLNNALSQLLIGGHPPGLPSRVSRARGNLQS